MLDIDQIKKSFPDSLRESERNMLREYIQYLVLDSISESKLASKLIFLGGTAVRIIHGSKRFSEDLDFDNLGVSDLEFLDLSQQIGQRLESEGFTVELETKKKQSNFLKIKFPSLFHGYGLSGHKNEKLLIKLDAEAQNYEYEPELALINKFGVFTRVRTVPLNLLLAQKISAFLGRNRTKARDIYDIIYLCGLGAKADMKYLQEKMQIQNAKDLKATLLAKVHSCDIKLLCSELSAFLFDQKDLKYVEFFEQFIEEKF